jgi:iron-sulfur cluster assembly protein/iron-sulfur cluster insertion protein
LDDIATTSTETRPGVSLSQSAVAKVAELMAAEQETDLALRLAVRPGGCSGFSYELQFDRQVDADDFVVEYEGGVRLAVDPQSMEMLHGTEIDYRDGLQGAGFAIANPGEARSCGCGQSFC